MPPFKRTTLLIKESRDQVDRWREAILRADPQIEVRVFPFVGDPRDIDFALVWKPPQGMLASLPNLRAVMSVGAGVDHVLSDRDYPMKVPLVRMVDPGLSQGMVEYITMATLLCSRQMYRVFLNQSQKNWDPFEAPLANELQVGFLGLGEIGLRAAEALRGLGFRVMGWSRTEKHVEGITTFHAKQGLERMLGWSDVLVNVLPLTRDTRGILGSGTFNRMPKGSCVINVGRGAHCNEDELLRALDSGRLNCAVLDVFQEEPLPTENPLWNHEKVIATPHHAGLTKPESGVNALMTCITQSLNGEPLSHVVDVMRGY